MSLVVQVGPGEVDKDLQGEIEEECTKYGPVERTAIHEARHCMHGPTRHGTACMIIRGTALHAMHGRM